MKATIPSRPAVARPADALSPLSLSAALAEQLASLYQLVQGSAYVFGSPLGPFSHDTRQHHVPRFVYFGPHTNEESVRLAFYAGFDRRDLRGTLALLHFVEQLAVAPDLGQSLNISFFPLVDVLGLLEARDRDLAGLNWHGSEEPELALLARDARLGRYHGFVRVESAGSDDTISIQLRGFADGGGFPGETEFINSEDTAPWSVRWEAGVPPPAAGGPLSLAGDLAFTPFELTIRVPSAWSDEAHRRVVSLTLRRFITRYRSYLAYGQHL